MLGSFLNGPLVVLSREHVRWYKLQLAKGVIDFGLLQKEKLHMEYAATITTEVIIPQYLNLMRRILTKEALASMPDVCDEVERAFQKHVHTKGHEWVEMPCFSTIEKIVSAGANRLVVGAPLCK